MSEEQAKKTGIRPIQVAAAALAAVTAALLGSTLGVAGTVLGAGLASVITTVGGELYLRSLDRTKEAALRARTLASRTQVVTVEASERAESVGGATVEARESAESVGGATVEAPSEERTGPVGRLRKLRWPLLIGTSVVGFGLAVLIITGFEFATGSSISGDGRSTIGQFVGGNGDQSGQPAEERKAPETREAPTTTPSAPEPSESSAPTTTPPAEPSDEPTSDTQEPPVTTTEPQQPSGPPSTGRP